MERSYITLRQWRENYNDGVYAERSYDAQVSAGWYDWFCSGEFLSGRLTKFGVLANKIANDRILDDYRVWFKNNCPLESALYDDMRFEPLDESRRKELYFIVSVDERRDIPGMEAKYKVYTARTDYGIEYSCNHVNTLAKWIDGNFRGECVR